MLVISELFRFMLTPWLLPIVLFHILIACVSLWSFDCFSWSLRSLSNHFAPLYSCSILFCDCFGPLFCHFGIFMITELSFYSFCMSSCLLSKALSLVCIIFVTFGRANRSFYSFFLICIHFACLHGCCPWLWDCFGLSVVYLHGCCAPFLIIFFFLSFSVTFWPC